MARQGGEEGIEAGSEGRVWRQGGEAGSGGTVVRQVRETGW